MRRTKHPGKLFHEYILKREENNIQCFAALMKVKAPLLQDFIDGQIGVNEDFAKKLYSVTGISEQFWLNMQLNYDNSN